MPGTPSAARRGPTTSGFSRGSKATGVHDGLSSYWKYDWGHALCNAHHLRELTFVEEQLGQAWAGEMKALLREIKQLVDEARSAGEAGLSLTVQRTCAARYGSILAAGFAANPPPERPPGKRGRPKRGKVLSLLDRLSDHRDAVLVFMRDFAVPFDNNQAERDIRMVKVQQKVSGCFRKTSGATMFCRIRGYISTARKQGRHALPSIENVFRGSPFLPSAATDDGRTWVSPGRVIEGQVCT